MIALRCTGAGTLLPVNEKSPDLSTFGAVMTAPRIVSSGSFFSTPTTRQTDKGTHIIEGLRIFKAATFADSMGIVRTWEESHLEQMAFHFRLLRDAGTFPNVPVRVDHSFSAQNVIGYLVDVYRDRQDPMFLSADIEITEPDAYEKWERGTYRSRSLEVGMYETNDEAAYWPVVMGLAFVDIPAVEGLHAKGRTAPPNPSEDGKGRANFNFSQTLKDDDKETKVDEEEFLAACAYAAWVEAAEYAQRADDWIRAADYAAALDAHQEQAQALGLTANHGRLPAATFRVGGQEVSDTAQVQQHITALETFQSETISTGRSDFVNDLASDGRIAATQVDSMQALVATMNDTQFEAFKGTYEGAPTNSLFGQYGQNHGGGGQPPAGNDGAVDISEVDTLEEIVANHRRTGKSQEQIEKLDSFKKLQQLKQAQGQ